MNEAADDAPESLRISMDAKATVKVGPFARSGKSLVAIRQGFAEPPTLVSIARDGKATKLSTFNDVALAVINVLRRESGAGEASLAQAQSQGLIEYIPFPQALIGKYQSFTQADIGALRKAGYRREFLTVEEGVSRYLQRMADRASHEQPSRS